jgi:adenylylsulfate kinase
LFRTPSAKIIMDKTLVTWHPHAVAREDRERLNGHRGCVVWFTGYSGCGKSTVANALEGRLFDRGIRSFVLDGDNIRHGLNASPAMLMEHGEDYARRFGLGFSEQDRRENIRRIGTVAQLFASAGLVTLTAFVSPYRRDRDSVRQWVETNGRVGDFIEVFVDTPLEICEARDPKGLYKKARAGELSGMTGIDDPYEPPERPELTLDGANRSSDELADQVFTWLQSAGLIPG